MTTSRTCSYVFDVQHCVGSAPVLAARLAKLIPVGAAAVGIGAAAVAGGHAAAERGVGGAYWKRMLRRP